MARGLVAFDKRVLGGAAILVGIDEAGRGCLAGPVVAAAVRCGKDFYDNFWCHRHCRGVDDSKRLNPRQRASVVKRFMRARHENWIRIGIACASVQEIERHNIYQATVLAMRRAFDQVCEQSWGLDLWNPETGDKALTVRVVIDGKRIRTFDYPHRGIVNGDQQSLAIALAGIHAKEWRDAYMCRLGDTHPEYGFASHKGYGTPEHLEALRRHGPTVHHRPLFLRKFREGRWESDGMHSTLDSLF